MVVSIDKGEKNDVHPIYKKPIGERLASCALHLQYDKKYHIQARYINQCK